MGSYPILTNLGDTQTEFYGLGTQNISARSPKFVKYEPESLGIALQTLSKPCPFVPHTSVTFSIS